MSQRATVLSILAIGLLFSRSIGQEDSMDIANQRLESMIRNMTSDRAGTSVYREALEKFLGEYGEEAESCGAVLYHEFAGQLARLGRRSDAADAYGQASDLFLVTEDLEQAGLNLCYRSDVFYRIGRLDESLEAAENALAILLETENTNLISRVHLLLSAVSAGRGDYESAISYVESLKELCQEANENALFADAVSVHGSLLVSMGDFSDALTLMDQVIEINESLSLEEETAQAYLNRGTTLLTLGRFIEALDDLERAEPSVAPVHRTNLWTALGNTWRALGDFDKAISYFEKSIERARNRKEALLEGNAFSHLGDVYFDAARYTEAKIALEEAANKLRDSGARVLQAEAQISLGILSRSERRYADALGYFSRASATLTTSQDRFQLANISLEEGHLYFELGRYDEAFAKYGSASSIFREKGAQIELSESLMSQALVCAHLDRIEEGEDLLEECQAIVDGSEGRETNADALYCRAQLKAFDDLHIEAESYFEQAILAFEALSNTRQAQSAKFALMQNAVAMGKTSEILDSIETMEASFENTLDWRTLAGLARLRAETLAIEGETESALAEYIRSGEILDAADLQVSWLSQDTVFSFNKTLQSTLWGALSCLSRLPKVKTQWIDKAYGIVQRFHGRGLVQAIAQDSFSGNKEFASLIRDHRDLVAKYSATQLELSKLKRLPVKSSRVALRLIPRLQHEISSLANDIELKREKIRAASDRVTIPKPANLEAVQRALGEKTALIEYVLGEGLHAFIISSNEAEFITLELTSSLKALLSKIKDLPSLMSRGESAPLLSELSRVFLSPVLERLPKSTDTLLIASDRELVRLPFEALSIGRESKELAIHAYQIAYVHSGTSLLQLQSNPPSETSGRLLALGDPNYEFGVREDLPETMRSTTFRPLPKSFDEVLSVAQLFATVEEKRMLMDRVDSGHRPKNPLLGDRFVLLVDRQATEANLKRELRAFSPSVIHLACHGEGDSKNPSLSYLALANPAGEDEDGLLWYDEIKDLNLDVDLVALSACATSRGPTRGHEGTFSLARGALIAGARSVLSTLWEVPDGQAKDIVTTFYHYWLEDGLSRIDSLRQAKLDALERGEDPSAVFAWILWDVSLSSD